MDKTMKRQIGYKPAKKEIIVLKKPFPVPNVPTEADLKAVKAAGKGRNGKSSPLTKEIKKQPIKPVISTAKEIISWINDHPIFAWGRMCKLIGIDKANFSRTMAGAEPVIAPEIVAKIVAVISKYGFGGK